MEDESELSVTQLKEKRQLELAVRELEELECQRQEEERVKQEEDQGIDWGMGEFTYGPQPFGIFQPIKWMVHELYEVHETVLLLRLEGMDTSCPRVFRFTVCC